MGLGMHRLIKRSSLPTEEKERLSEILERTLRRLDLVDRNDALTESIARMIIDLDRSGVRDPDEIAGRVLRRSDWTRSARPNRVRRDRARDRPMATAKRLDPGRPAEYGQSRPCWTDPVRRPRPDFQNLRRIVPLAKHVAADG